MIVADRVASEPALAGRLRVVARRDRERERTVIDTIRQEGLARCSRPLVEPGEPGAARLVVSQLGPGFVRGDRFVTDGDVGAGADLVVVAQSAARVLGRGDASEAHAAWRVARGARLSIAGEPTIAYDGASHRSFVDVTLAPGASFAWTDTIGPHGAFGSLVTFLRIVASDTRALLVHDRLTLTPERLANAAVGSAYYVRAGIEPTRTDTLIFLADAAARRATACRDMRIGVGSPAAGGVAMRARGPHAGEIRDALRAIVSELRRYDRDAP